MNVFAFSVLAFAIYLSFFQKEQSFQPASPQTVQAKK